MNHFKDLISSQGVEVSSVIPLRELKVEYKTFEAKTALCHRHEAFLADEKILRFLPKFLGKAFYSRRKFPLPINLTSKNLSKEVEKALRTVVVPMSNKGTCSMLRIGNTSMKESHLVDNILQGKIQCWPNERLQVLFYEAKVPIQMGMAQCKDVATPLSNKGINTSHWHFQRRYVTFV